MSERFPTPLLWTTKFHQIIYKYPYFNEAKQDKSHVKSYRVTQATRFYSKGAQVVCCNKPSSAKIYSIFICNAFTVGRIHCFPFPEIGDAIFKVVMRKWRTLMITFVTQFRCLQPLRPNFIWKKLNLISRAPVKRCQEKTEKYSYFTILSFVLRSISVMAVKKKIAEYFKDNFAKIFFSQWVCILKMPLKITHHKIFSLFWNKK